jgi:nickel-dependent lactate racemase
MVTGKGSPDTIVSEEDVKEIIEAGTPKNLFENKRVLVLTPDATRTCPLPMMIGALHDVMGGQSAKLDFMVALGTHSPLSEEKILELYGISAQTRKEKFSESTFFNHRWDLAQTFLRIGHLNREEIEEISGGLLKEEVPIDINQKIHDYDLVVILGPVFPHEVVGYSGGSKYFFPGISGGEFLHFFHWLGAVITCSKTIGVKDTPVRQVINRAMEKVNVPVHCLAMVVHPKNRLCGLYVGDVESAWSDAADLSSQIHVVHKETPYRIVLGRAPEMYDEIWTAGKVMYKLEQVVADGGKLIIYAPHIRDVSRTWGEYIERIGYHVRDYFLAQMDKFKNVPRGVLAHSTHVRGIGTYENGIEKPRIDVVLATGIPRQKCEQINLGYMNPDDIKIVDYMGKEDEGILYVDHAGEILHRLERQCIPGI